MTRFTRILMITYCLEVSVVLSVAPWTNYWDRNYFVEALPFFEGVLTSGFFRGLVTGVGVFSFGVALVELFGVWRLKKTFSRLLGSRDSSLLTDPASRSRGV